MKRISLVLLAFVVGLAFVACGDDDESAGSAGSAGSTGFAWPTGVTYGNANATTYTETNYTFDGGLKALSDQLWAGTALSTATTITGVVTYVDSYFGDTCFIQDKDAALYLYGSGISVKPIAVGDKISLTVSASSAYGQAPQVTAGTLVSKISTGEKVYFKTVTPADGDGKSLVHAFKGVVKTVTGRAATITVGTKEVDLYVSSYEGVNKSDLPAELAEGKNVLVFGPAHAKDGRTQVLITSKNQLAIW